MKKSSSISLEETVERAKRFVSDNLGPEITVIRVASAVGELNCIAFLRLFQETEGIKFADFVTRTRLHKAKNLLLNPHYGEIAIAEEVGFGSVTTFRRSFIKAHGESPTEYRKKLPVVFVGKD